MKTVSAWTVRRQFGSILDEVKSQRTHILIARSNEPVAVLVPYQDYQDTWNQEERCKRVQAASKQMDLWAREHTSQLKGVNSTQALREMRNRR